jgi:hypothetical protein
MAFCTNCGAAVGGAFCNQCGTPSAKQPAAATAPPLTPGGAPPPAPALAPRKTSPIVWVLVVLLCLFGLGVLGAFGVGAFFVHKARRAGVDGELFRNNPGLAVGRMLAAVNPNLEVVRTNEAEGTVTLRDRHNGKRFSINIDAARHGSLTLKADDEDGKTGSLEIGGSAKIPTWIPKYPGSHPEATFSASGESDDGVGEAGNFTFKTDDPSSEVLSFYRQKAKELGMTLHSADAGEAATVVARDDERRRFLKIVAISGSGETAVNVTYGRKR